MGNHTPGPWHYQKEQDNDTKVVWHTIFTEAVEVSPGHFKKILDKEWIAEEDARLMAASPDLLRASRHALMWLHDVERSHHSLAGAAVVQALRDAIAKAEGN